MTRPRRGEPDVPSRRDALVAGAAFVGALVVYALTMPPSLTGGDSGEFVTATYVLGVVHPTGYPLYMLLGKAFETLIPFGTIAFRLALLSVVCAAAAAALVAWVYMRCGGGRIAALLAGLSAAFVGVVWSQAIIAEVYALNALLVMLGLAAFAAWFRRRTPRSLVALCGALALTVAHHRTGGFALGPFVLAALLLHRPVSLKVLAKAAAAFVGVFALYLYFPIRSAAFPPASWTNVLTWHDMARFFAGTDWANKVLARRGPEMWAFVGDGLSALRADVSLLGIALALLGWGALAARSRVLWICSTAGFLLVGAWAATYDVWDAAVFALPCYLFFGLWLAAGVEVVARALARARPVAARAVVALALAGMCAWQLAASWGEVSLRNTWDVTERGEVILANTEPGARMLVRGHAYYTTLLYLTLVEGRRPDLLLVSSGLLGNLWYQVGIPDRVVRLAAEETMVAALRREVLRPQDFSPYVVRRALAHGAGARPLVTNFAVSDLPDGTWQKGLPHGLFEITGEPLPAPESGPAPAGGAAAFPLGLNLVGCEVRPDPPAPGEIFALDLYWRPDLAVEQPMVVEATLAPRGAARPPRAVEEGPDDDPLAALDIAGAAREASHFQFEFPVEYGVLPLQPLERGRYYRQTVHLIASRALPPGPCDLRLRVISEGISSDAVTVATLDIPPKGR